MNEQAREEGCTCWCPMATPGYAEIAREAFAKDEEIPLAKCLVHPRGPLEEDEPKWEWSFQDAALVSIKMVQADHYEPGHVQIDWTAPDGQPYPKDFIFAIKGHNVTAGSASSTSEAPQPGNPSQLENRSGPTTESPGTSSTRYTKVTLTILLVWPQS